MRSRKPFSEETDYSNVCVRTTKQTSNRIGMACGHSYDQERSLLYDIITFAA